MPPFKGRKASKHFFVDEAHFRADADLHSKWTQKGQPALVDSTSPRLGEKVTYYSAVCVETGEVEALALEDYSSPEASVAFLRQLRRHQADPLVIIWDNGPVHSGEAVRAFLAESEVRMHLLRLPPYSPDYNADEAIWKWARAEATANICLGTAAKVRERVDAFFATLPQRTEEVKRRCRTRLHAEVAALASVPVSPEY
jgi:transposase